MSDLISRADAIEAVIAQRHRAELSDYNFALGLAEDAIRHLPSADAVSREEYDQLEALYDAIRIYDSSAEAKGDLISRQDAVNTIKRYKHRLQGRGQTYGFLLEEFEHRIPSASAEAVQGWIPCSERLPEFPFISCDAHGNLHIPQGIFTFEDSRGTWCIDDVYDDKQTLHYGNRIIAWMPLPKPYKGGDDE